MELKVGQKFRYSDLDIWHIIGFIKDKDTELVAVKSWAGYKNNPAFNGWLDKMNSSGNYVVSIKYDVPSSLAKKQRKALEDYKNE